MKWLRDRRSRPMRAVAFLAAGAFILAACGDDNGAATGEDDGEEGGEETASGGTEFYTLATGSTGGTYFPLGGAMAGVWNDNLDNVRVNTQSSGASVENLRLINAGEVQLMMAVNGVAADALVGEGAFEDDGEMEFSFLGNVYPEVTQIIARADSGIESIADMRGMNIAVGPPGSGTEVIARTILEAEGIDPDNDITAFGDTFGDAADAMRDGRIDAAFAILALPAGSIEEVGRATDINMVSIEGELLETLLGNDETLSSIEIEAGTYPGQDAAATAVTNWATLYGPSDLDEDIVYDLVRVLYEETESIAAAIAVGNQIQIETALDGRGDIPVHPGAQRYFDEVGAS